MKFGLLLRPQDPPDADNIGRRWQESLTAAEVAEEAGFDGVFVPEHHMRPDGHNSAPLIACAALAARTRRVEIGTTVLLLPYYHPIHVAEQAALVDVISGGRLRLGCALGANPAELDLYGLDPSTQVARFEESIDLIRQAWSGADIAHHGPQFDVAGKISPTPEAAELWMGATSTIGARRAARFGAPWITDSLHGAGVIEHWARAYRDTAPESGSQQSKRIVMLRDGWVADSLDEVERVWWPCIRDMYWSYFHNAPSRVLDLEPSLAGVTRQADFHFENHRADRLVVGTPDQCVETIRRLRARVGADYLIMSFRMAEGPGHSDELRCIERFGREVIPAFR